MSGQPSILPRSSISSTMMARSRSSSPPRCSIRTATTPTASFATRSQRSAQPPHELVALGTASRPPRRTLPSLQRRTGLPLRHPHGHRRLPRHAPPSPLRAVAAGVTPISTATKTPDLPRPANPRRSRPRRACTSSSMDAAIRGLSRSLKGSSEPEAAFSPRSTACRSARAAVRCSRWTSPKLSISQSCAQASPATSAIAASHGRCIARWPGVTRRWPDTSASRRSSLARARHAAGVEVRIRDRARRSRSSPGRSPSTPRSASAACRAARRRDLWPGVLG
jgi:hypothetical protein